MRAPQLLTVALVLSCGPSGERAATPAQTPSPASRPSAALGHRVVSVDESATGATVSLDLGDRLLVTLHGAWEEPVGRGQQGPTGQDRVLVRQDSSPGSADRPATARFLAVAPGRDEVTAKRLLLSGAAFAVTVVVR